MVIVIDTFKLARIRGSTLSASVRRRGGDRLAGHLIITIDVKNGSYCYFVRCATLIVGVGGNALAQKQARLMHTTQTMIVQELVV